MKRDVSDRFEGLIDVNRRGILKGIAAGSVTGFSLPVRASADGSVETTVKQNGQEVATVSPISTDRDIRDFYRYDEIDGASANTPMNLREEGVSKLFFYRQSGSNNPLSLVVIHDAPNNGNGGDVRFDFDPNSLPNGGSWAVKDDSGDAEYSRTRADWGWAPCCTDGGAYRGGFGDGVEVTIDPSFDGGIGRWDLLDGDGTVAAELSKAPVTLTVGGGTIPCDFEALVDEKLALAGQTTSISPSIDERDRVEETLASLRASVDDETASSSTATEAVERMIAGEQITETLLEGLGPETTAEFDTAGRIVDFSVDAVIELLLTAIAFGRVGRWVGWGKLGKSMGKARSLLSRAVSKVVDTITSGLSKVSNKIHSEADLVSEFLENLITESGITEGTSLATKKAAKLSGWRDGTANTLIALFEQNVLFTDVNDKLNDLDETLDPDAGGPDLSGTLDGAREASEQGISDVKETLDEADDRLDIFRDALKVVRILGLIAMVLVASVWGSLAGAALSLVYAIFSVGTALMGAADGIDFVGRAVAEHNGGVDDVIAGQPEV